MTRRLLALVSKPKGRSPGQRYRLEQWARHLEVSHGLSLHFRPFESEGLTRVLYQPGRFLEKGARTLFDSVRRAGILAEAKRYDGVVLYREAALIGPPVLEELLSWMRVPLVLDFDDAIWMPSGGGVNGPFTRLRWLRKTQRICRLSTAVTVGNAYLAEYARAFAQDVSVVPTTIDLDSYPVLSEPRDDGLFTITWTGSHSTLMHLERVRPALELLARRRKVRVRVICDRPPERPFEGAETEFVSWSAATEAEDVAAGHVGIMPLPDNAFTRGKCSLKALQYMAVGRPVVLSPVGTNKQIVRHGVDGLFADSQEEWVHALDTLAGDASLRVKMGTRARETVEQGFSARRGAALFAEAVNRALSTRP